MIVGGLVLILFSLSHLHCNAQTSDSLLVKLDENTYQLDKIKIDLLNQEISFPAQFNMTKGLIETILVGPQGRLHETVLMTPELPSYIQTALLMMGLECGQNMELGNYDIFPKGDSVLVFASWVDSTGEKRKERVERFVWNVKKNREMQQTPWIFLGSKIVGNQFMADLDQNIMRTYHDPYAIIHSPLPTITDDTFYEANEKLIPPKGTKATIIIQKYKK